MEWMPKNVLRGRNSDGTTFRLEEWDFSTLTTIELGWFFIKAIAFIIGVSVVSPLLILYVVFNFIKSNKILIGISLVTSSYFLFDCYHGWLALTTLYAFCGPDTLNVIVCLNIISFVISLLLLLFGDVFYHWIVEPLDGHTMESYMFLNDNDKKQIDHKLQANRLAFYFAMFVVALLSILFIANPYVFNNSGWAEHVVFKENEKQIEYDKKMMERKIDIDTKAYYDKHGR